MTAVEKAEWRPRSKAAGSNHIHASERARATKDVDLRLIGSPESVFASLQEAGRSHGFHDIRKSLPTPSTRRYKTRVCDPPAGWSTPYREFARENELAWATLEELAIAVGAFLNPVLAGNNGIWHAMEWQWS
jgi:hypothetical protein